jgi:DNA-binding response OmpR family regulator
MADVKRKILIVEDEAPLRKVLAEEFTDSDYIVFEAGDGLEGLEVALREKPDLILLDQLMPKLNGVGMLRQLRTDQWGAKVPVIMATNMSTTDTINEAIEAGANDYFIKSEVTIVDIMKLVDTRLSSGDQASTQPIN